jgi:hypothetical protein
MFGYYDVLKYIIPWRKYIFTSNDNEKPDFIDLCQYSADFDSSDDEEWIETITTAYYHRRDFYEEYNTNVRCNGFLKKFYSKRYRQ